MPTLSAAPPASNSPRLMLVLLGTVFFLPFAVGSGLFWLDWRPANYGNYGALLQPPRTLPEVGLRRPDGSPLPSAELRGKWLLVLPTRGTCDAACELTLRQMSQVQLALNKERGRVQRVLIASDSDPENLRRVQRRFADLIVATRPSNDSAWNGVFDAPSPTLYVADPQAKVMLRYADPGNMRGVLKDLERLLKYSLATLTLEE